MKKFASIAASIAALMAGLIAAPAAQATGDSQSLRAFGLTDDNQLVRFRTNTPQSTRNVGFFSGLQTDTKLVGIDFRVQDGLLYGVGDAGGIYTIDTTNAALIFVDRLDIALIGTSFGVDFNPAANALRIISDTGQNLRHPFATLGPTVNDGFLQYPPMPPAMATPATGVAAAAYMNNDLDTNTATTLFDIDTNLDQVIVQSPANSGMLVATGKLGVDAGPVAGFDVFSRLNHGGTTVDNRGFASLLVDGRYRFYQIQFADRRSEVRR
jgi:hypothetical protein